MKNYIHYLFKFRWLIAISVPFIVFLLAVNLKNIEIDGNYRIWFEKDSQKLVIYDKFRSEFSNDNGVTIVFRDENGIFNKKALQSIKNITDALWDMKHIERVASLTNYQYIHNNESDPDDIRVDNFIENIENATPEYLANRKEIALSDSTIVNGHISKDGTTTMIFARLEADANEGDDISTEVMNDIHAIVDPEAKSTGYKFWFNGGPAITHAFIDIAGKDAMIFTPLVFLLSMLLLFLLFRRVSGAIIPMLVVLFTFLSVLAVQVLLGYKLNNFTANIPVFIIAIGVADAVHIYSVWLMQKRKKFDNFDAVYYSLNMNFLPILLTSITTIVGFTTLAISNVVPIATLGIATASGAVLAFIISVVWMPAVLLILNKKIKTKEKPHKSIKRSFGYGAFIIKNDKKIIFIASVIVTIIGFGLFHIKVDSNIIRYFDKEAEIRKSAEFIMENLTGSMSYTIIVDSNEVDGVKEPEFLKTVEKFYKEYKARFPKDVRHIFSLLDVIKQYNKVLNNKNTIPESRNLISQYLLLYSMSLPEGMEITDRMDFEQRKLCVTALINIVDASKELEMIYFAENWWRNTPYNVEVTGQAVLYAFMQKDVTDTLIYSFLLTLLIVSFIIMLIFKRFKILWILLLPNILPVVLVLGIMGWFGFKIDMGVAITGAIIIGVAMDDTIHFLIKYFDSRKQNLSKEETFDTVLHYVGKAIFFTTVVLAFSFSMFAFSTFVPNQNFGIVTAVALLMALIIDLLLLPALLSVMDNEEYTECKENKAK